MKINIKEFTGDCSCGRDHQLVVDDIILEEGALKKLPEILSKESYNQYKHLVMVCDDNTYEAAGKEVEELLGKYTALADWKITNILDGEYICDRICEMEYDALDKLKESLDGLCNRDIKAYEELMYGLLLSGLAMQMTGHSRPASGAEHHMAHFWEMAVINEEIDAYHGEKVGVGLIQVSDIYHEAVKYLKEGNFKLKDHVEIETDLIEKTFTNKELCESIKKTNDPNLLELIDPKVLKEKTGDIIKIIEEIPKADEIVAMLEKVHGVKSLEDIGFTPDMKEKTARVAPYIRDRITFLRILKFYDFYDQVIK